jgi:hypothetical protein
MRSKTTFSIFIFALLIISCNNSNNIEPKLNFSDAIKLEKGNYWVYETKTTFPSQPDIINANDSTFIRMDSIIRGNLFHHLENQFGRSEWKRDSLGYIVNLRSDNFRGDIEFSATNTIDTLYRFETSVGFMGKKIEQVIVPAGTFSAGCFYVLQKGKTDKKFPDYFNDQYFILSKKWYANNIGLVKSVFYYNGTGFERNLIRYKVK